MPLDLMSAKSLQMVSYSWPNENENKNQVENGCLAFNQLTYNWIEISEYLQRTAKENKLKHIIKTVSDVIDFSWTFKWQLLRYFYVSNVQNVMAIGCFNIQKTRSIIFFNRLNHLEGPNKTLNLLVQCQSVCVPKRGRMLPSDTYNNNLARRVWLGVRPPF